MIPRIHEGPRVTYVTNIFPGKRPGWLVRTAEDLRALLQDSDNFVKRGMGQWAQGIGENWLVIPTEADPPLHGFYRKALNPQFSPQKMMALSDGIRERARALIAKFKDGASCDFLEDFAVGYPVNIVLDLLGLPQDRMAQFLQWEREMLHTDDMNVRSNATRQVRNYLLGEIESRRQNPRDDYITRVLDFEIDGRKWNADEVFGHCFNLYLGGLDTVTSHLGLVFYHLATHPEHQAQLRADLSLSVVAVEEMLRAYAPVTSTNVWGCIWRGANFRSPSRNSSQRSQNSASRTASRCRSTPAISCTSRNCRWSGAELCSPGPHADQGQSGTRPGSGPVG
jgi:cytochrome P450